MFTMYLTCEEQSSEFPIDQDEEEQSSEKYKHKREWDFYIIFQLRKMMIHGAHTSFSFTINRMKKVYILLRLNT